MAKHFEYDNEHFGFRDEDFFLFAERLVDSQAILS
jgi:hypothetical protein